MKNFTDRKLRAISLLAIGKTAESTETQEFKRYIGVGGTFVKGVNPTKKESDEFFGFESQNEPEYVVDTDNGKEARITFLIQTDAEQCGVDLKTRAMFILRNAPAYNQDKTKVQVIDNYGNYTWANVEDAKAGNKLLSKEGKELKIDSKYRMACVGECDLVAFLKAYLCAEDVFKYVNGSWVKKDNPDEYKFALEHIKDYFTGNFTELKEAIALRPNNKVKLLYGVRTTDEGKQYQAVCTRGELVLRNSAGANQLIKLEKDLANAKANGAYQNIDYQVCELKEWDVNPTNLEKTPEEGGMPFDAPASNNDMPWD